MAEAAGGGGDSGGAERDGEDRGERAYEEVLS